MSTVIRFLARALVGTFLALVSVAGLANTRSSQFVVMVRVLPHCQWSLPPQASSRAHFTVACTRNTGYSLGLARANDSRSEAHSALAGGVGNGAEQVIPLSMPTAASAGAGAQSTRPLFLTINY
ncbi:MAG: hypothetical protein ACRESA_06315 [Gammaproteobacteria bacterium]